MTIMLSLSLASCLAMACLATAVPSPQHLGTLSILAADTLVTNDTKTTSAAVLLNTPRCFSATKSSCEALGESLWSPKLEQFTTGLNSSLAYEVYAGRFPSNQLFWIGQDSSSKHHHKCEALAVNGKVHQVSCDDELPTLCTQSAPASNITFADTSIRFQTAQHVGSQTLIGYRDFLTFRYLGVRFAEEPERFTYSTLYKGTGVHDALDPAPECLQTPNNGSTDCLFLNIWTTLLPSDSKPAAKDLKPVMVYIYGGGYTSGSASNPTNDGSNLAARGDVVVVDLAYRLSTLGFLVLEDGIHNGNYWLSDCIAGLQWVRDYIESFGGDPDRVTIFGESAGALTVQHLTESPQAKGLFRGAILQSDYYEPSINISTSYEESTVPILNATGCLTAADQLACLQAYNATALINLKTISNTPVIDGKYLPVAYIDSNNSTFTGNSVPWIVGVNHDEEGVLGSFFHTTNLTTAVEDLGATGTINTSAVLTSGLFPLGTGPEPSNLTLDIFNTTTRISTDAGFRCADQYAVVAGVASGVLPKAWFYEFNRTYQDPGYDMYDVCQPPKTSSHPFGDPSAEYFKCHAGDLANTFGNIARVGFPFRDENDVPFMQLITDYWTSFARNLDPNPDMAYLEVRGYWSTIHQIAVSGAWDPVTVGEPMMMELQWNSVMRPFRDAEQCAVLGFPPGYPVDPADNA